MRLDWFFMALRPCIFIYIWDDALMKDFKQASVWMRRPAGCAVRETEQTTPQEPDKCAYRCVCEHFELCSGIPALQEKLRGRPLVKDQPLSCGIDAHAPHTQRLERHPRLAAVLRVCVLRAWHFNQFTAKTHSIFRLPLRTVMKPTPRWAPQSRAFSRKTKERADFN